MVARSGQSHITFFRFATHPLAAPARDRIFHTGRHTYATMTLTHLTTRFAMGSGRLATLRGPARPFATNPASDGAAPSVLPVVQPPARPRPPTPREVIRQDDLEVS